MFLPCFFTMSFDKSFSSAQQTSAVLSNGTFNLDTSFIWSRSVFRKADIGKEKGRTGMCVSFHHREISPRHSKFRGSNSIICSFLGCQSPKDLELRHTRQHCGAVVTRKMGEISIKKSRRRLMQQKMNGLDGRIKNAIIE